MAITSNDLLAQGSRLAAAGQTNEAIALWQQAARHGNVGGFLNIGTLYMQLAFATDDEARRQVYIASAVSAFKPIAPPEFEVPAAAFSLGMIAEHLAQQALQAPDLTEDVQLAAANGGFVKAAEYFKIASDMPDSRQDGMPGEACLKLATYQELGIGGYKKDAKAAQALVAKARMVSPQLFEAAPEPEPA